MVRTDNPSPKRQKKNTAAEPDFEYDHGEDLAMHSPPRMPSVEEGEDESEDTYRTSKAARFIESYPGDAGKGLRKSKTNFETWFENQRGEEKNPWAPFASEQEWALAIWLMKNVGQKSTDEFLKLQIVSILCLPFIKKWILTKIEEINSKEKLSFYNSYSFLKKVDQLPTGPEWKCSIIKVSGDVLDEDGKTRSEQLELWYCDPIECIKELIGNPAFKDYISYVPERVYMDKEGKVRVFDEMWTGDWWWEIQV